MVSRAQSLLPEQFGPLQGVRIISTGTFVAEPFAAALAAQMGAEVIHIERPGQGDSWRSLGRKISGNNGASVNSGWVAERRNTFHITLDTEALKAKTCSWVWFLRLTFGWRVLKQVPMTVGAWMMKRSSGPTPESLSLMCPATVRMEILTTWAGRLST